MKNLRKSCGALFRSSDSRRLSVVRKERLGRGMYVAGRMAVSRDCGKLLFLFARPWQFRFEIRRIDTQQFLLDKTLLQSSGAG